MPQTLSSVDLLTSVTIAVANAREVTETAHTTLMTLMTTTEHEYPDLIPANSSVRTAIDSVGAYTDDAHASLLRTPNYYPDYFRKWETLQNHYTTCVLRVLMNYRGALAAALEDVPLSAVQLSRAVKAYSDAALALHKLVMAEGQEMMEAWMKQEGS
ncbi:hypothetical protein CspHIS471_0305020 [Cutaneotrichosporon sp. HIS471]|nr:hypothetical protein CspHIS471_0305020 [Cutaneotrichosporon sp. HIS471]